MFSSQERQQMMTSEKRVSVAVKVIQEHGDRNDPAARCLKAESRVESHETEQCKAFAHFRC